MGMIIFFVLSIAACIFLIYALVHFHNELMRLETKSSASPSSAKFGSTIISQTRVRVPSLNWGGFPRRLIKVNHFDL
jgi:hypothetical protein